MVEITNEMVAAVRFADFSDQLTLYSDDEIKALLAAVSPLIEAQARAAAIEEAAKFVRKHPSITFDEDADKVAADMLAALTSEPRSALHPEAS